MSAFSTLEMTIEGPPGVFREEWGFEEVRKIQRFLESLPGVDKVVSFANFIREFDRDIFLLETTDRFDSFLSSDYSTARVSARIQPTSTAGQLELLSKVEESAPKELDKRLRFRTTGAARLYATKATALINGQVRSLGFSMVVITLLLILYLRSIRVGLLSMIPNVLPVLMTLGMMGLSGISLNLSTVMISCIAIAIAVDDTIHFLVRYRREILTNGRVTPAIERTMFESGRAMVFTSLVIAGGFSILLFSSFAPIEYFGLLTAFTMITALGADLLVLPFLIKLFKVMQRVVESDEARQDGRAHSYLGTLATLHSPALGGKPDVRPKHFERVIETSTSSEGRG